jgi:hypothetical protein
MLNNKEVDQVGPNSILRIKTDAHISNFHYLNSHFVDSQSVDLHCADSHTRFPNGNLGLASSLWQGQLASNKSLKPTVTRVTPFAEKANPAPRNGGLVPPFCD